VRPRSGICGLALLAAFGAAASFVGGAARAEPAHPDLVVRVVTHPAQFVMRGAFLDVGYRISNVGSGAAAKSLAGFALSRDKRRSADDLALKPTQPIPRLGRGRSYEHSPTFTIPRTAGLGAWYVIGCADVSGRVRETNERNNCRASGGTVEVQEGEP
jgi:CARDB